uniref:hypothetical protein n=1 Tax=uncultured Christiangramia sp. TaxID=503836 RepID=UPI002614D63B|nr:hypothetical protein [uncultured Christiangramia sp.]
MKMNALFSLIRECLMNSGCGPPHRMIGILLSIFTKILFMHLKSTGTVKKIRKKMRLYPFEHAPMLMKSSMTTELQSCVNVLKNLANQPPEVEKYNVS